MITLYSKTGQRKIDIHEYTYNGAFMGESYITATIKREEPLNFEMGDYVIYKGNPFTLNYVPAKQKQASVGSTNDAFIYDTVKFNSVADELTRCRFLDFVANDSGLSYSQLPNFNFTASTAQDLARRLQVNLDREYKDDKRWTVTVDDSALLANPVIISIQNVSCWDALTYVNSQMKLNYLVHGRQIIIGASGIVIDTVLEYGKNKGLFQIKQSANADAQIITRLRAYGSTRNITTDYYREKLNPEGKPYLPDTMHMPNLMLPDFPQKTLDPYIQSDNIDEYGVREGCIFFDGQNGTKEIYPSIEGVTAKQLTDAGYSVSLPPNDNGNIDEILACDNPQDDGKKQTGDKTNDEYFTLYLKDLGFGLADKNADNKYIYANVDKMQVSLTTGMCAGRTFDLTEDGITKDNTLPYTRYVLKCKRVFDDSMQLYFPSQKNPINFYDTGDNPQADKFVLLGINMPDAYVDAASQRLYDEAQKFLDQNKKTQYSYEPEIDNLFLSAHPEIADQLTEGAMLLFRDKDLNIDTSAETIGGEIIQNITIDYGKQQIPAYKLTLSNQKSTSTIEKIQQTVNSLAANMTGVTPEQVMGMIRSLGSALFLSKQYNDSALGKITFENVVDVKKQVRSDQFGNDTFTSGQLGSGFRMWKASDGESYLECDNLLVRREMDINTLTIGEIKSVGGQILVSLADMVIVKVEEQTDVYRCYFDNDNGSIGNKFQNDDQAICRIFDGKNLKYYWRRVVGVGDDYVDLSKTDKDGDGIPQAKDKLIQLGNRTDTHRQSAIMISAYGSDAPSFKQYAHIDTYDMTGKEVTAITPAGNKFVGDLSVVSGNDLIKVPADKGAWSASVSYVYYDRVSHNGSLWLCIVPQGKTTTQEPTDTALDWHKQVEKGSKGDKGDQGTQGIPGTPGKDGVVHYTWLKYADTNTGGGISNDPTGKKYIGFAYNKTTPEESNIPTDYKWSLIKGTDGVPGAPGKDGQTTYTWIKYSDNPDGTGMYDIPTLNTKYIGIAVNKLTPTESDNKTDYVWTQFKGDPGTINYIEWKDVWKEGNDIISGWNNNGSQNQNIRVYGTNPFGVQSLLWKCIPELNADPSGGWNTSTIQLDQSYAYRYTVFVKKNKSGSHVCFGCLNVEDLSDQEQPAAYFYYTTELPSYNDWFLLVGIIHPNTITNQSGIGGLYDMYGKKMAEGIDFKFRHDGAPVAFRSYGYYGKDLSIYQLFFNPMVHRLDGTEPSIEDILQLSARTTVDTAIKQTEDEIDLIATKEERNGASAGKSLMSQIKQRADEIDISVKNIQVGGQNLLRNSNFRNDFNYWHSEFGNQSVVIDDRFGTALKFQVITPTSAGIYNYPKRESNKNYVISGYIKSDTPMKVSIIHEGGDGSKTFDVTTEWQRYETQGIWRKGGAVCFYSSELGTFYLANLKYEQGNKATGWSPAPEDIGEIAGSELSINGNAITLASHNIYLKGSTIAEAIKTEKLQVGSDTNPSLRILPDGSFYAKGYDPNGYSGLVIDSENHLIELASPKVADGGGNPISGMSNISISSTGGGIKISGKTSIADDSLTIISSSGIFADTAGQSTFKHGSTMRNTRASIVGLGRGNIPKGTLPDGKENFVAGVFGSAYNSNTAPAYGGYFEKMKSNGIYISCRVISSDTTIEKEDTFITIKNSSQLPITISMPFDPHVGQLLFFCVRGEGHALLHGNGVGIFHQEATYSAIHTQNTSKTFHLVYDGEVWC